MTRAAPALLAGLLGFLAVEAGLFHSGLYAFILSPESAAGRLETVLRNERLRPLDSRNQILAIGDSRMALVPRIANELFSETGYTYASIGVDGSSPRMWYYMLRDVDPNADRYRAVILTLESYDDADPAEDQASREADLSFLAARLSLSDLREFAGSYPDRVLQLRTAAALFFRGLLYRSDVQDLLLDPKGRLQSAALNRRDSHLWIYEYVSTYDSLAGLEVDWESRVLTPPPGASPELEAALRDSLIEPLPPATGRQARYMERWLRKIYQHYAGSATRLIFVRVPRGPWIRPDLPPPNSDASVRRLAGLPGVTLLPEDFFNELETPETFRDQLHLNQPGMDRFTRMLATQIPSFIGPPI